MEGREVGGVLSVDLPRCRALIDQDRKIGNDPVGHACMNAAHTMLHGFPLCDSCVGVIRDDPRRVSFPGGASWDQWREADLRTLVGLFPNMVR